MDDGWCRCWIHWRVSGRQEEICKGYVTACSEDILCRQIECNLNLISYLFYYCCLFVCLFVFL